MKTIKRRKKKANTFKKTILSAFLVLGIICTCSGCIEIVIEDTSISGLEGPYEVVKVVDGDTIKLMIDGEKVNVRLIGVDTPESVHPDKEKNVPEGTIASDYMKELIGDSDIYIEYGEDPYDQYDRPLVYAYLDEDTMINAKLVAEGYAQVMTVEPNDEYEEYFLELEEIAEENDLGFWGTGYFDD